MTNIASRLPAQPFTIDQPGTVPLTFEGWQLAAESSEYAPRRLRHGDKRKQRPDRPADRWTEVRIYLTMSDLWVVEYLGCSRIPGEVTLRRVEVCEDPVDVLNAVRHAGSGKIPGVSAHALRAAAEKDERLASTLQEAI